MDLATLLILGGIGYLLYRKSTYNPAASYWPEGYGPPRPSDMPGGLPGEMPYCAPLDTPAVTPASSDTTAAPLLDAASGDILANQAPVPIYTPPNIPDIPVEAGGSGSPAVPISTGGQTLGETYGSGYATEQYDPAYVEDQMLVQLNAFAFDPNALRERVADGLWPASVISHFWAVCQNLYAICANRGSQWTKQYITPDNFARYGGSLDAWLAYVKSSLGV